MEKFLVIEGKLPPRKAYSALDDFETTLAVARGHKSAWSRCVNIANVARFAPEKFVVELAEEALTVALEEPDLYQQVAAAASPLRALIERNHEEKALQLLPPILELAKKVEPTASRAAASFVLWRAIFPLPEHEPVLAVLAESRDAHRNGRGDYHLRDAVLILASENPAEAQALALAMPEGRSKRQALKRLAAGETYHGLPFFGKPLFEF